MCGKRMPKWTTLSIGHLDIYLRDCEDAWTTHPPTQVRERARVVYLAKEKRLKKKHGASQFKSRGNFFPPLFFLLLTGATAATGPGVSGSVHCGCELLFFDRLVERLQLEWMGELFSRWIISSLFFSSLSDVFPIVWIGGEGNRSGKVMSKCDYIV